MSTLPYKLIMALIYKAECFQILIHRLLQMTIEGIAVGKILPFLLSLKDVLSNSYATLEGGAQCELRREIF